MNVWVTSNASIEICVLFGWKRLLHSFLLVLDMLASCMSIPLVAQFCLDVFQNVGNLYL